MTGSWDRPATAAVGRARGRAVFADRNAVTWLDG